jgi:hypothetical protein
MLRGRQTPRLGQKGPGRPAEQSTLPTMKTLFSLLLLTCATLVGASAQTVNYEKIIPPPYATQLSFADRLVQLAWQNHAANRNYELDVISTEKAIKLAKFEWLDLISLTLNINTGRFAVLWSVYSRRRRKPVFPLVQHGHQPEPFALFHRAGRSRTGQI